MKNIQQISIWYKGQNLNGKFLEVYIINDNLKDSCKFWWGIFNEGSDINSKGICISEGNLTMNQQDYIDWNTNPDINDAAYYWIAEQLGLTII